MAVKRSAAREQLRNSAEVKLDSGAVPSKGVKSLEDANQLHHELQVHQIELEMQNEELRRSHVELAALKARYFDLYDLAPVGFCTVTSELVIRDANITAANLLGVPRSKLVRGSLTRFICKEDRDNYYLFSRELFASGTPQSCELRMVKTDGTQFWVQLSGRTSLGGDDLPLCYIVLSDITERKKRETYREMGREVLQILNDPGDISDSIEHVISLLKMRSGFDAVGIRLQHGDDFPYFAQQGFPEDFLHKEDSLLKRGVDGGLCRDIDGKVSLECTCGLIISGRTDPANPLFTKGGSCWTNDSLPLLDIPADQDPRLHPRNQCIHQGYASVALVPVRDKERIVGLLQFNDRRKGCFTLDMIELLEGIASLLGVALMRKRSEQLLLESEERHRAILRTAMDGFWVVDMQGRLMEVNEAYCRMSGYSSEELLAMSIPDLEATETADDTAARMEKIVEKGEVRFESIHRRKEGIFFHVEVSVQFHPVNGGQCVVFLRDITERKRVEERLSIKKSQLDTMAIELAMAEESERRRLAIELHDQIGQTLVFAKMKLDSELKKDGHDTAEVLAEVRRLVDDSIHSVRSLTLQISPPLLYEVGLEAALDALGERFQKEHRFRVEFSDDSKEKPLTEAVKVTLFQVVRELLVNVAKHAQAEYVAIVLAREADKLKITVWDDGVGFDVAELQGRDAALRGFGLASISQRIEHLGGRVQIKSASGEGASITIWAPLDPAGVALPRN